MSELTALEQTKLALNTIGLMDFGRVSGVVAVSVATVTAVFEISMGIGTGRCYACEAGSQHN
jgi:hypothetical protein